MPELIIWDLALALQMLDWRIWRALEIAELTVNRRWLGALHRVTDTP